MRKRILTLLLTLAVCLGLCVTAGALEADSYQSLSSGDNAAFFIKEDGTLWGWGKNESGAVGNGTTEPCPTPVKILDDVVSVETHWACSIAIKRDGSLWAWGDIDFDSTYLTPKKILDHVSSVLFSEDMWAIIQEDGSLWTWGIFRPNDDRMSVFGGFQPEKKLEHVTSAAFAPADSFSSSIAAVTEDGSLWTWGYNSYGRLGDGSAEDTYRSEPVKIMDDVASVSSGRAGVFLAIKKNGTLWSWGGREYFNCRGRVDGSTPLGIPTQIMTDVAFVNTAAMSYFAGKTDGSIWSWGLDLRGRDQGGDQNMNRPIPVMDLAGPVKKLYVSTSLTFAIQADGTLWTWGDNYSRLLGCGSTENHIPTPSNILNNVSDAASSNFCAFALQTDGTLWGWGEAQYFAPEETQSGHRSLIYIDTPRRCLDGVAAISCGDTNMFAKQDGSLWAYVYKEGGTHAIDPSDWYYELAKIADNVRLPGQKPIAAASVEEPAAPVDPVSAAATPTASTVLVNGEKKAFDAYNIEGSNYFKLRDLAYVLNGTDKQFEVGWDAAANAISLTSGKAYTAAGGEMAAQESPAQAEAVRSSSKILLDGAEVALTAYTINGNNYFKLRDLGQAFDFGVGWDGEAQTISIDTSTGYTAE